MSQDRRIIMRMVHALLCFVVVRYRLVLVKIESCRNADFVAICGTRGCHDDNLGCCQWQIVGTLRIFGLSEVTVCLKVQEFCTWLMFCCDLLWFSISWCYPCYSPQCLWSNSEVYNWTEGRTWLTTENRELSWRWLCQHWLSCRFSLWQPPMPSMITK